MTPIIPYNLDYSSIYIKVPYNNSYYKLNKFRLILLLLLLLLSLFTLILL